MSMDMERFHQTFFEESFEGLQAMEAALLDLDPAAPDGETINTIFRAAHSIKGGAGTFGFAEIAAFTHLLETLLDQVRAGERPVTQPLIDVVLQSGDELREMLEAAQAKSTRTISADLMERLEGILAAEIAGADNAAAPAAEAPPTVGSARWKLIFKPLPSMMQFGNDPLRIIRELGRLGELQVEAHAEKLPALAEMQPEDCYLWWSLVLETDAGQAEIQDIFAWVEDDCELEITRLDADAVSATDTVAPKPEPAVTAEVSDPPQAAPVEAEPAAKLVRSRPAKKESGGSIRVDVEKIDTLINLVGELVITQAMLEQMAKNLDPVVNEKLLSGLGELDRNTRHLQEAVMSTRMLPMEFVFSRFPRVVRDTASKLGKQVKLDMSGEGAELDKGLIEKITDPLNHIVRNAIDHGIEMPDDRAEHGKPAEAKIRLAAWHQGGQIAIQVSDDGRGLNREKILAKAHDAGISIPDNAPDGEVWQLIFHPGLSTAAEVTDISGRGVGMDVVRKNIQSLGGSVDIESQAGIGTKVTIRLPLTLAILDGMSVRVGEEIYIVPLNSVVESLQPEPGQLRSMAGERKVLKVRGEFLPLLSMRQFFGAAGEEMPAEEAIVVIVEADGRQLALIVDDLVGQQQVVIKSLERNYKRVSGVSGATILGDGQVALILDVGGLLRSTQPASAA